MNIHIKPSKYALETLSAIEEHALNLWQLTNPEETNGALVISFGSHFDPKADLHITVINECHIKLGIEPYLREDLFYSSDIDEPQHLLHWVNLYKWGSDETDLLTHFIIMLIGLINCPSQLNTHIIDWLDVRMALQLGSEASFISMLDADNFQSNYHPKLVSSLMLLNTEGSINKKLIDAQRYLPSPDNNNQELTLFNLTHQYCIPRTNTAIFISNTSKQLMQ